MATGIGSKNSNMRNIACFTVGLLIVLAAAPEVVARRTPGQCSDYCWLTSPDDMGVCLSKCLAGGVTLQAASSDGGSAAGGAAAAKGALILTATAAAEGQTKTSLSSSFCDDLCWEDFPSMDHKVCVYKCEKGPRRLAFWTVSTTKSHVQRPPCQSCLCICVTRDHKSYDTCTKECQSSPNIRADGEQIKKTKQEEEEKPAGGIAI